MLIYNERLATLLVGCMPNCLYKEDRIDKQTNNR